MEGLRGDVEWTFVVDTKYQLHYQVGYKDKLKKFFLSLFAQS